MHRQASISFCKALLVVLTLGLPLHAPSDLAALCPVPKSANDSALDSFALGSDLLAVVRRSCLACSTPIADFLRFAPNTCADNANLELIVDSAKLCPQTALSETSLESTRPVSDSGSDQSGGAAVELDNGGSSESASAALVRSHGRPEFDRAVYYRNKEFAFDGGWLPINIPLVFDVFMGDAYNRTPLNCTLVPLVASLHWHIDDVGGHWRFRGNLGYDFQWLDYFSFPGGTETRYFSYDMGIRRNFVPRRGSQDCDLLFGSAMFPF